MSRGGRAEVVAPRSSMWLFRHSTSGWGWACISNMLYISVCMCLTTICLSSMKKKKTYNYQWVKTIWHAVTWAKSSWVIVPAAWWVRMWMVQFKKKKDTWHIIWFNLTSLVYMLPRKKSVMHIMSRSTYAVLQMDLGHLYPSLLFKTLRWPLKEAALNYQEKILQ